MASMKIQAFFLVLLTALIQPNQSAVPRLLILGPTGTEKMKIANILLGSPLSSDDRLTKTEACARGDFCGFEATG